jgi:hypothetical protein
LKKVRNEFGFAEEAVIKISLADVNAAITEGDQLQTSDKVFAEES